MSSMSTTKQPDLMNTWIAYSSNMTQIVGALGLESLMTEKSSFQFQSCTPACAEAFQPLCRAYHDFCEAMERVENMIHIGINDLPLVMTKLCAPDQAFIATKIRQNRIYTQFILFVGDFHEGMKGRTICDIHWKARKVIQENEKTRNNEQKRTDNKTKRRKNRSI